RIGNPLLQGFAADGERVGDGLAPFRGVDDVHDLAVLDQVHDVRTALQHLVDTVAGHAVPVEEGGRATRADQTVAAFDGAPGDGQETLLVGVAHRHEDLARRGRLDGGCLV